MNSVAQRYYQGTNKRARELVTPEGIALPLTLASRGTRFGALCIDLFIISLVVIGIAIATESIKSGIPGKLVDGVNTNPAAQLIDVIQAILIFLVLNAYFLFFELGPRGATLGKRMTGIRIAARGGERLSAEMVIARNLLRDIELFMPMTMLIGGGFASGATGLAMTAWFLIFALFPFFNKDRLRAGDLIAGTWVVEAPKRKLAAAMSVGETARAGTSQTTGAAYRFGDEELAIYGEYELQTLERVLREDRQEAMVAVHEAICRKIGWNPGAGDERAFLEAYYTQLRGRLESGMRFGRRKADKWSQ
jgi:uncharacterized RDD family membrane protein YckC